MKTIYDYIKEMQVDKLAEYLEKLNWEDNAPWDKWFNEKYCDNCPVLSVPWAEYWEREPDEYNKDETIECSYCEYKKRCKFFPDNSPYGIPEEVDIIKLYLNSTVEEE